MQQLVKMMVGGMIALCIPSFMSTWGLSPGSGGGLLFDAPLLSLSNALSGWMIPALSLMGLLLVVLQGVSFDHNPEKATALNPQPETLDEILDSIDKLELPSINKE